MNIIWFIFVLLQPVLESICEWNVFQNASVNTTGFPKFVSHGAPYDKERYPYIVKIWYDRKVGCTGSMLSKTIILTAAHCVKLVEDVSKVEVFYQQHRADGLETSYKCKNAWSHQAFNDDKFYSNDVGILELTNPIKNAKIFSKIGGSPADFIGNKGVRCTVIGFGFTVPDDRTKRNRGQMVEVAVFFNNTERCCWDKFFNSEKRKLLCVDMGPLGTCAGDSGGPVICNGYQYGVTSHDDNIDELAVKDPLKGCGTELKQNRPVFLYFYKEWIANITNITGISNKKKKKKKNCAIIPSHQLYYMMVFFVTVYNGFFK